jgi:hypothetical protein
MHCAITCLLGALLLGAAAPRAVVREGRYDFGSVVRGAVIEHEFVVHNDGDAPLRVRRARMTAPLVATRMPAEIAPEHDGTLRFALDTGAVRGPFDGRIVVSLDDPSLPELVLPFEGEVVSRLEVAPRPAFFVAARRGERKRATVDIINHEPQAVRIEEVAHASERFTTELETLEEGRRWRLTLVLRPDGPAGRRSEPILVRTSSRTEPVLRIAANTYVHERVYTFPEAVDLGALRWSDIERDPDLLARAAQTLMVYQSGGSDFRVSLDTDVPVLALRSEAGPAGDRYQVTITPRKENLHPGRIDGSIVVRTNDPEFPTLTVPVSGDVLAR